MDTVSVAIVGIGAIVVIYAMAYIGQMTSSVTDTCRQASLDEFL